MIWFPCKQCGKVHGRAENSAGTMIFCDCGHGITVPWESTAAPSAAAPEPPPAAPAWEPPARDALPLPGPRLEPMKFESVPVVAPVSPPPLPGRRDDREAQNLDERDRPRRPQSRPTRYRPDPNFCLNHATLASKQTCTDCREAFCADCVALFQGEPVCGPCKNFRVRALEVPPKVSGFALTSLILGLIAGPLVLCLLPAGRWMGSSYLALAALLPQLAALVLGVMGLRLVEANPKIGGWSLALTGLLTATVASFLTILVVIFGARLGV